MSHAPSSTDSSSTGAQRVLLVDDNVDAVESMEILLQAFGYEVATAVHPDVALAGCPTRDRGFDLPPPLHAPFTLGTTRQ